ncbi:thiol:disulfide interchange protein [Lentisphaera araneosa HTCC2155]|uniref:Thiol:disulfide interchange protein n=1 Tax=Lentisphaera araneosa HTCC2155 TaxID=313628 RepID=A6DPJ3_9BACT|nr:protein-disulfide reductase DsbD domain-containing protein [Lentisphaera araneosa]EDM26489.1 thiol:disulfide interchange protein [Lentisphaera araneosa HTCC2155]
MRLIPSLLLLLVTSFSAYAEKLVDAKIILPRSYAAPGQVRQIIIKTTVKKGWHIYWKNPGESGLAPSFTWHGDNYDIKKIHWPTPKAYTNAGILNNIYDGEVLFIADLLVKPGTKDGKIDIKADIDFLVCKESCIMQSVKVSSTIEVNSKNMIETMQIHPLLSKAMDLLPRTVAITNKDIKGNKFSLDLPNNLHNKELYFAFDEDGIVMKQGNQKEGQFNFTSNEKTELKGLIISKEGPSWRVKN